MNKLAVRTAIKTSKDYLDSQDCDVYWKAGHGWGWWRKLPTTDELESDSFFECESAAINHCIYFNNLDRSYLLP